MKSPAPICLVFLPLALAGGCAHYEYDVVHPPELAQHVGTKDWVSVKLQPLEYRLLTSDNRLVILVYNTTDRLVKLSGADSAAVDSRGESHPLQGRTIVPGSYVKLILPPPHPQVRPSYATVGFGVGVGYGNVHGYPYRDGLGYNVPYYGYDGMEPRYYSVYDANDRTYFEWPQNTELRLLLAYEPEGGERFRHEFVFRKRRM